MTSSAAHVFADNVAMGNMTVGAIETKRFVFIYLVFRSSKENIVLLYQSLDIVATACFFI